MNRSYRLLVGSFFLAWAVCGFSPGCQAPTEPAAVDQTLLSLAAEDIAGAVFGGYTSVTLTVTNDSDRAVLIARIQPMTNPGGEAVSLVGSAYGSTRFDPTTDTYAHDQTDQQTTNESFCSGLLLPGESLNIQVQLRPVAQTETFGVTYYVAGAPYDQTAGSLAPLNLYVLSEHDSAPAGGRVFQRFSPERWNAIRLGVGDVVTGPGEPSPRSVLIGPGLHYAQQMQDDLAITFALASDAFTVDRAEAALAGISDPPGEGTIVGYCQSLGGYVIEEPQQTWLLTKADQTDRGRLLPRLPAAILNDVDRLAPGETIRVQVGGDQGDHVGPDVQPTGRDLWDAYPTEHGDGTYTRGEFVRISAEQFSQFLDDARAHDMSLDVTYYFFSQRYFTLE